MGGSLTVLQEKSSQLAKENQELLGRVGELERQVLEHKVGRHSH